MQQHRDQNGGILNRFQCVRLAACQANQVPRRRVMDSHNSSPESTTRQNVEMDLKLIES